MSIVWQRVSLSGFGRFESTVTLELQPGMNVIVARNERGKSTLLTGITAVLFGLPASSDPNEFGQAKLRNWNDPLRFEGELQFAKDDAVYRVRRNFATHAVTVSVQTQAGWSDTVTGEHNPRARRRNVQYERFLQDAVGILNAELFWSAFAFGSPLPEARELDEHVQRLLSGAGSGHYNKALEQLRTTAFGLTKFSKKLGIADRDRRTDGQLELLIAESERLEEQLRSSRQAVDEQQELQTKLNELQEQRQAAAAELRTTEAALEAWTAWRDARTRHRRALAEQSKAMQAWQKYNSLAEQLESDELRLDVDFPELQAAAPDIGDKLEQLRDLEARAEAERARMRAEVTAIVRRGAEKLAAWRTFVEQRDELGRQQTRLEQQFHVFEQADAEALAAYAQFKSERAALERRVEDARAASERARAATARRAGEQARLEQTYADLAGLDEQSALQAIDERIAALQRRDDLIAQRAALYETAADRGLGQSESRSEIASDPGPMPGADREQTAGRSGFMQGVAPKIGASIFSAVLLAFGAYKLAGWPAGILTLLIASGLSGLLSVMLERRRQTTQAEAEAIAREEAQRRLAAERLAEQRVALERLSEQLQAVEAQLAHDERLGSFSTASAHELGVLSQRLAARREAAAALNADVEDGFAVNSSQTATDAELEEAVADAEAKLHAFREQVRPGIEQFGDNVADAHRDWTLLRAATERLRGELQRWVRLRFGVETLHPEDVPLEQLPRDGAAKVWLDLAHVAATAGKVTAEDGGPTTVGQLVASLSTWDGPTGAAVVEAVIAAGKDTGERAADGKDLSSVGTADLLRRLIAELRHELTAVLEPVDGDVAAALARWQQFRNAQSHIGALRAQQTGLLAGQGADKPDTLHERALDAGNRAAAARGQMEQLSEQHAALPEPDQADDGDVVEERLNALQSQAAAARATEATVADEYRGLLERQATLAGASVINIAGAELELQQMQQRRSNLEFEIETIAVAYRELVAAAEEYEKTHRDVLADGASNYVQQFTGRGRRIVFDEQFQVFVQDPDGPLHAVSQLSQGARDQLYLAIRLAIADLVAAEAPLPLLLDDPFVHCDAERLERIRTALQSLEGERQVVLFSHRDEFAHWGHLVQPGGEGWDSA